jgi:hypothetical protein
VSAIKYPPNFASDEEAARVYTVCGKIAISWGPVEMGVEGLLILARRHRNMSHAPFPYSFKKKVTILKSLLRDDARLVPALDFIRPTLGRALTLHHLRSWVVHSICQGTNLSGDVMFGMSDQRRKVRPTSYTATAIPAGELESAVVEMRNMPPVIFECHVMLRSVPMPS